MKLSNLTLSNLNITEDHYDYKGLFTLTGGDKSLIMDISDLDNPSKIKEIKIFFGLEEDEKQLKKDLTNQILEKASIVSPIKEGENYQEDAKSQAIEKTARSLDMS